MAEVNNIEVLKNYFEIIYLEYKDYEKFIKTIAPQVIEDRKNFASFAQENKDNIELLIDKLVEVNEKPVLYQNDLQKLQLKLAFTYEAIKEIIEIPLEIRAEIEKTNTKQLFKIENNEAIPLNEELLTKIKEQTKSSSRQYLMDILKQS